MREKHLIIVDYRPEWAEQFEAEKVRILGAVENYIEAVEHIGSTSVAGLAAKPVIDITIGVKSLIIADQYCIEPIVGLGYEYVPQFEDMMPTRRYFRRSNADGVRSHQIHLWALDDPEYERHLVFRDYLRAHPDEAAEYARLKRSLVDQVHNVSDYADAKSVFIKPCEQRAFEWKASLNLR